MVANLAELLARAAAERPDQRALIDAEHGLALTWAELDHAVDQVGFGLADLGIRAGQRVLLAMSNRVEFVTAYLGILRVGAIAVPINPQSSPTELQQMAADSGARVGLTDETALPAVREALRTAPAEWTALPTVVVVGAPAEAVEVPWADFTSRSGTTVPPPADPESLAVLLYTSGTSARPRAAMLTHRALLANVDQVAAIEPAVFVEGDVSLAVLPLFHVYGLNAVLGQWLRQVITMVLVDRFDPEGTLAVIQQHRITVLPVAPPVLAHWRSRADLRERLAGVRLLMSGSAPLGEDVLAEFARASGLTVHQGYGLTEAAPVVTSTMGSEHPDPATVGIALPGVEVQLREETGAPVVGGDPGEIVIRGANLFSGYWPDGADGPDPEGWFGTGDVGYVDDAGNLVLVDRLRELVIVSGFNVYPSEIEEVISEVPGVAAVAVIGVPDDITGEAVHAYVVPVAGQDSEGLAVAVTEHCALRLARFKQPARVDVVSALPLGITGKVQKGRLRASARRFAQPLVEGP